MGTSDMLLLVSDDVAVFDNLTDRMTPLTWRRRCSRCSLPLSPTPCVLSSLGGRLAARTPEVPAMPAPDLGPEVPQLTQPRQLKMWQNT